MEFLSKLKITPGTILWAITALIALLAWRFPIDLTERQLSISLLKSAEIISTPDEVIDGSLDLIYNSESVTNLIISTLRIQNSGNEPISGTDFHTGLVFSLPDDTRIINYSLVQVQPDRKDKKISGDYFYDNNNNQLIFETALMNPGDIYEIEIISTRSSSTTEPLAYMQEDINLDYDIVGLGPAIFVNDILTNSERQAIGRVAAVEGVKLIGRILVGLMIIFLVAGALVFIEKYLTWENSKIDRIFTRVGTIIFVSIIAMALAVFLGVLYNFLKAIHDGLFLNI